MAVHVSDRRAAEGWDYLDEASANFFNAALSDGEDVRSALAMFEKRALLLMLVAVGCTPLKREEEPAVPTTAEERTAELTAQYSVIARLNCPQCQWEPCEQEPWTPHLSYEEAARHFDQTLLFAHLEDQGALESEWAGTATKTARRLAEPRNELTTTLRLVHSRR